MFEELLNVPLFKGLTTEEIEKSLKDSNGIIKKYRKNQSIALVGKSFDFIGIVLSGKINVLKEDIFGNSHLLATLEAGDMFGEVFFFAQSTPSPMNVVASQNTKVLALRFIDYTKLPSQIIANMLNILSQKNIVLRDKLDILSQRSIRDKLVQYFGMLITKTQSAEFDIPFNRQELADFLSVDRSALSRELCKMKEEGILLFSKNRFSIKQTKIFQVEEK